MNEIIDPKRKLTSFITDDGVKVVDSRDVANHPDIKQQHFSLTRKIKHYCDILTDNKIVVSDFFIPSTYKDSTGRTLPNYYLTPKGCEFIAHKMTGEKGIIFTALYINAFHENDQPDGYVTIDELAKLYSGDRSRALGRNRAFEILRMTKHLMSNGMHKNVPYQEHIDNGHMVYKTVVKSTTFGAQTHNVVLIPARAIDYFFTVFDRYYTIQIALPTVKQIKLF